MKLLKANPDIKRMSIEGHTDNRGALEMNNKLSQDRADSVMKYLSSHGIDESRLEAHGYGPAKPIETNDTERGARRTAAASSTSRNKAPREPMFQLSPKSSATHTLPSVSLHRPYPDSIATEVPEDVVAVGRRGPECGARVDVFRMGGVLEAATSRAMTPPRSSVCAGRRNPTS